MDFAKRLDETESFAEIFSLVKESAEAALEKRRDGLMLALQYLPESLGAYFGLGSNFIVMNKALLEKFRDSHSANETKAYVFSILLHEYLHSLGYVDEELARALTYEISKATLGKGHMSTRIARQGIAAFVTPSRSHVRQPEGIEVLDSFTIERITYIG